MADGEEDVLELEDEIESDEEEIEAKPKDGDDANAGDGDDEEGDESETVIGFAGEEAPPAPESESSVIREMRRKLREKDRQLAELSRSTAPAAIEVGDEPTLESSDYDEDRFKAEWSAWNGRKAAAERQQQDEQKRTEAEQEQWSQRVQAYEADKARLSVAGYEEAEGEVMAALSPQTQALIMLTGKPAALVYALSKSPAKLEELSKLDLARAAMMVGKLEDQVQVTKRKTPDPDRPVRGNASPGSVDKELARLEKEAARTGDRTKLIAYKRKANGRGK